MQVTVEKTSDLGRKMTIVVENVNLEQSVQQRLQAIRPKVKMAGFRPGKVPMSMLSQSHGPTARREVIDQLVQDNMREAFEQEQVNPASVPNIVEMNDDDSNFTFAIEYEAFPELDKVSLDNISIEKTIADVTDEDVEKMLETLRDQRATWEPLKRAAKEEDGVTIDFIGRIDGVPFPGGSGKDLQIVLGSNNMLPEFEQQLIGAKPEQNLTVTVTFPDDYRSSELQGKTAEFDVTVKEVSKKKLPKLDKEFAEACGVADGIAALKKEVRSNMERELKSALKTINKRRAMDSVAENNAVPLPKAPIDREANFLMEQAKNNLRRQGVNVEGLPFEVETFLPNAEKRVKLSLLIGKIISDNKIQPDETRVREAIDTIAASYEDPQEVVDYYQNNQDKLSEIQMTVVEDTVVEWIFDNVKVDEKPSTFSEVMNAVA